MHEKMYYFVGFRNITFRIFLLFAPLCIFPAFLLGLPKKIGREAYNISNISLFCAFMHRTKYYMLSSCIFPAAFLLGLRKKIGREAKKNWPQ